MLLRYDQVLACQGPHERRGRPKRFLLHSGASRLPLRLTPRVRRGQGALSHAYREQLSGRGFTPPRVPRQGEAAFVRYPVRVLDRARLRASWHRRRSECGSPRCSKSRSRLRSQATQPVRAPTRSVRLATSSTCRPIFECSLAMSTDSSTHSLMRLNRLSKTGPGPYLNRPFGLLTALLRESNILRWRGLLRCL
jgi:hypothetical protein